MTQRAVRPAPAAIETTTGFRNPAKALVALLSAGWRRLRDFLFSRAWPLPLVISVALSVVLIERKHGLFRTTFLSTNVLRPHQLFLFLAATMLVDLTVIYTILTAWNVLRRPLRLGDRTFVAGGIMICSGAAIVVNFVAYNLTTYLGDLLNLETVLHVSDGKANTLPYILGFLSARATTIALVGLIFLAGCGTLCWLVRGVTRFNGVKLGRNCLIMAVLWVLTFALEFAMSRATVNSVIVNVRRTSLQTVVAKVVSAATDFDGDGYGWIDFPPDKAPFDNSRYPFALNIPGNGIDEGGTAGDLPIEAVTAEGCAEPRPSKILSTPDIIVIIICSLRHDVVFGGEIGPGVAPTLMKLSRQGVAVEPTYSHNAFTTASLKNLFCGHLVSEKESLVRDLKAFGYAVGIFSTQNEGFGNCREICGLDDADYYFDASMAVEDRVSTYTTPSSLIIPGKRLLGEIDRLVPASGDKRPLFLYVQFEGAHFPYNHDSPLDIVPHPNLSGRDASPEQRADLVEVYRNAVANVDAQVAQLLSIYRQKRPGATPVILVFGDHGESLFDDGTLGHGLLIDEVQSHVPGIIVNGWVDIPVPFGLSGIRPYLLRTLQTPRPASSKPKLYPSSRPMFQYCGGIEAPSYIANVDLKGRVTVDFLHDNFTDEKGTVTPLDKALTENAGCAGLIHRWESLRYLQHKMRENAP
jgi:hypothetical protein